MELGFYFGKYKGDYNMKENRVLLWVTYISIASLLTLILMIVYGRINIDETKFSEWVAPSTIATLIGGLGGALAGTWLSGYNTNRLWQVQEQRKEQEKQLQDLKKRKIFNSMIYAEIKDIEVHTFSLVCDLTINDYLFEDVPANEIALTELFYKHLDNISYCVTLIENAYKEGKTYSYTDTVDYDVLIKIANVRVRTNNLYQEYKKYEHDLRKRLRSLDMPNSDIHNQLVLKTMIGLNLCRKLIIELNEFFIEHEKE